MRSMNFREWLMLCCAGLLFAACIVTFVRYGTYQALIRQRGYVVPEDVRDMAPEVLRHRVALTYEAEAEQMTADDVVAQIIAAVPLP